MKQFNLEEWLKDKSRKVVTRDGKPARIVCTDLKNDHPIIAAIKGDNSEIPYYYDINGKCLYYDSKDLFFADEELELTEFEDGLFSLVSEFWQKHSLLNEEVDIAELVKENSKTLLDLARKEILKDLPKWKKITDETNLSLTLSNGEYYLPLEDLETLPKEE